MAIVRVTKIDNKGVEKQLKRVADSLDGLLKIATYFAEINGYVEIPVKDIDDTPLDADTYGTDDDEITKAELLELAKKLGQKVVRPVE